MTSIKWNNGEYTMKDNGYCYYKPENGTAKRISRKEFEEAVEAEAKATTKKATKKARKHNNWAVKFEYDGIEHGLTEGQVDFLQHLNDCCYWYEDTYSVWVDVLQDEIGGQCANKPMRVGAMVSTLREKGMLVTGRDEDRKGKPKYFTLTRLGRVAYDKALAL